MYKKKQRIGEVLQYWSCPEFAGMQQKKNFPMPLRIDETQKTNGIAYIHRGNEIRANFIKYYAESQKNLKFHRV